MSKIIRPKQLRYAFNDKPILGSLFLLACQQMIPLGTSLIFPVILLQQIQVSISVSASVISIVMIATAIATFLQAQRWRWLGSGTFLPLSATPNMLAQSMLAIKMGGLPLLFGMTLFAGLIQAFFSFFINLIRKYFPSEIAAMILALIGIDLAMLGLHTFIDFQQNYSALYQHTLFLFHFVEFFPLLLMIIFSCWGNTFLKIYGLIIAVVIGYVTIALFGFMDKSALQAIKASSWLFFPILAPGGYHFANALIAPFLIGALVNTVKICGSVAGLQEMQDANFQQPNMKQIKNANFTDAIGTILSGTLGSMGTNASSSGIAISMSTGVTSRYIAYPFALIVLLLAFCPKISLLFVMMPKPLTGAMLFSLGAALLNNGLKMMLRYITRIEQQLCIGISFVLGLSHDVYPSIFIKLPSYVKALTGSSIVIATLCAVILNFLFNLKSKKLVHE